MNKFTNSFEFNNHSYYYCDLNKIFETYPRLKRLPNSLKILLESNIRNAKTEDINSIIDTFINRDDYKKISFYATRVIMQDFAGLPAIVDFASMRDEIKNRNQDESKVNPQIMVDLVIKDSLCKSSINYQKEEKRNKERFKFAKWAANKFENLTVIPPNVVTPTRVNLEYLSTMISASQSNNQTFIFPEALVGCDAHSTMINALGVLGFNINGLNLEASMLGSSILYTFPKVVGVKVVGSLVQGVSINDVVGSLSNLLNDSEVENKIVEFYGNALRNISIEDRASLSVMVPKSGALCGYFSIDESTISFVEQTRGVDATLIKEYYQKQRVFKDENELVFDEEIVFDLSTIRPIVSGPKRPQDKIAVEHISQKLDSYRNGNFIKDNDIVFASISSTFNPTLLIQAGLLAKRACQLGLELNSNIKKEIIFPSITIKNYLEKLDLLQYLEKLGFKERDDNSKELMQRVSLDIEKFNLNVSSIYSTEKEFEQNINSLVKSNWVMAPALLIAYCFKGNMNFDITKEALQADIYLSDIWPSVVEVNEQLEKIDNSIFADVYKDVFVGNQSWQDLEFEDTNTYNWDENSTYIQPSRFFEKFETQNINIEDAKILALLDDYITTEYLSPHGQVFPYSPAALYLESKGLKPDEFNSFDRRRGNAEILARSTLSSIKLKNKMVHPKEGGYTKDFLTGEVLPIYDFSIRMKEENRKLVIFAGWQYGSKEQSDWAAKGVSLLGVKAIIARSFDETHRLDLISMGILPLEFMDDDSIRSLSLKGDEVINIKTASLLPSEKIDIEIKKGDEIINLTLQIRLDSVEEVKYYKNGGLLNYLLNKIV